MAIGANPLPARAPTISAPDGQMLARVSLVLTLYFDDGFSVAVRHRIGECLALFRRLCGAHLVWVVPPDAEQWQRIEPDTVAAFEAWLENGVPDYSWATSWRSGRTPLEAGEFQFNVLAKDGKLPTLNFLQLVLPMHWLETRIGTFPELAGKFAAILQPYHGYGGYGFGEPSDMSLRDAVQPDIYAMARRFPGIEVDRPVRHIQYLSDGIKGVNWLTVLSEHWVERVGGEARLRSLLDERFLFHRYDGGLIVQAGPRPQTGDTNQYLWPDAYATLARVLRPIRIRQHGSFDNHGQYRFTAETTQEWLARFDTDPPWVA
jgi:hypothetical protein